MISGSHRGAVAHAERVHSDRVGPFIADHERVANERQRATVKSIPNSELWRTVLGGPVHGALNLDGASPLRMPSGFSSDRVGRCMASHERVTIERYHSTAKTPRTSAVAYCVRRPNTHGPVTRRARCRARSERVQRGRVGRIRAGHERVTIETRSNPKPRRVVRMFSFGGQQ